MCVRRVFQTRQGQTEFSDANFSLSCFFSGGGGGGVKASNVFLPVRVCSIFSGAGNLSCPWTETAHTRHSK